VAALSSRTGHQLALEQLLGANDLVNTALERWQGFASVDYFKVSYGTGTGGGAGGGTGGSGAAPNPFAAHGGPTGGAAPNPFAAGATGAGGGDNPFLSRGASAAPPPAAALSAAPDIMDLLSDWPPPQPALSPAASGPGAPPMSAASSANAPLATYNYHPTGQVTGAVGPGGGGGGYPHHPPGQLTGAPSLGGGGYPQVGGGGYPPLAAGGGGYPPVGGQQPRAASNPLYDAPPLSPTGGQQTPHADAFGDGDPFGAAAAAATAAPWLARFDAAVTAAGATGAPLAAELRALMVGMQAAYEAQLAAARR